MAEEQPDLPICSILQNPSVVRLEIRKNAPTHVSSSPCCQEGGWSACPHNRDRNYAKFLRLGRNWIAFPGSNSTFAAKAARHASRGTRLALLCWPLVPGCTLAI